LPNPIRRSIKPPPGWMFPPIPFFGSSEEFVGGDLRRDVRRGDVRRGDVRRGDVRRGDLRPPGVRQRFFQAWQFDPQQCPPPFY
jgi:hypothetical protein